MAHQRNSSVYGRLTDRLNHFPQGSPPSGSLYAILKLLFNAKEAGLVSLLPIRPFTVSTAAAAWKINTTEARKILDNLADRALLVDMEQNGEQTYCLPPPMAGFFEFSLMRVRNDVNQQALSELFYQYLNVEEDFVKDLFATHDTPLGRIFPHESALEAAMDEYRLDVLDYERASHIVDTATHMGVSMCYCRHKMQHMHKACDAPMDICLTFNSAAYSLIKHGHARAIEREECHDLLKQAQDSGLVQFGENNREGVNFICNCCGCCCEALQAVKRFSIAQTIHSNYLALINPDLCRQCGLCQQKCPLDAISAYSALTSAALMAEIKDNPYDAANVPLLLHKQARNPQKPVFRVDTDRCIGCGVCVRSCPTHALNLVPRVEKAITPLSTVHRVVAMAAEKGTLQYMIFDNQVMFSHRLLAAVLGAILKLPGVGRAFARKQLRSHYLEQLISRVDKKS